MRRTNGYRDDDSERGMMREMNALGVWAKSAKYSSVSAAVVIQAAKDGCPEATSIANANYWSV